MCAKIETGAQRKELSYSSRLMLCPFWTKITQTNNSFNFVPCPKQVQITSALENNTDILYMSLATTSLSPSPRNNLLFQCFQLLATKKQRKTCSQKLQVDYTNMQQSVLEIAGYTFRMIHRPLGSQILLVNKSCVSSSLYIELKMSHKCHDGLLRGVLSYTEQHTHRMDSFSCNPLMN